MEKLEVTGISLRELTENAIDQLFTKYQAAYGNLQQCMVVDFKVTIREAMSNTLNRL